MKGSVMRNGILRTYIFIKVTVENIHNFSFLFIFNVILFLIYIQPKAHLIQLANLPNKHKPNILWKVCGSGFPKQLKYQNFQAQLQPWIRDVKAYDLSKRLLLLGITEAAVIFTQTRAAGIMEPNVKSIIADKLSPLLLNFQFPNV